MTTKSDKIKKIHKKKKKKTARELKAIRKLLDKVLNTPYSYENNGTKLSFDEEVLINLTYGDLKDKDGEVSKETLQLIWMKIKTRIKEDLRKGNHKNKLFHLTFSWNIRQKYFSELLIKENGLFLRLLNMYRDRFGSIPTVEEAKLMVDTCLQKFAEY